MSSKNSSNGLVFPAWECLPGSEEACPHDPEGVHHVGCGCDDANHLEAPKAHPCPACHDTLGGVIDKDDRCTACGHSMT